TVGECKRRLDAPGIAEIDVVIRNGALVLSGRERRIQGELRTAAREGRLGDGNNAQHRRVVTSKVGGVRRIQSGRDDSGQIDSRATVGFKLINRLIVDAAAVVTALVPIPVALIGAAELEKVI